MRQFGGVEGDAAIAEARRIEIRSDLIAVARPGHVAAAQGLIDEYAAILERQTLDIAPGIIGDLTLLDGIVVPEADLAGIDVDVVEGAADERSGFDRKTRDARN